MGANYWKLNFFLRAKLEYRIFGAVWPLIWWIWGGFRLPRGGCARYSGRFDINSTVICLAAVRVDTISTLF